MSSLLLIDGNSIINRAFYGQGRGGQLTAPDGTPTGAVYTFLNMFLRYLNEYQPTHICVTFDRPEPTFRHERYADYKKTRTGMPDDLRVQMPMLKSCLEAMRISCVEKAGFEADDLIGTLSLRFAAPDFPCYILSGDRDDFQLLDENITQLYPKTGGETLVYTPAFLKEKNGVLPKQVIDLKALMGDSSDCIPGIKGIGEKSALKLLDEYGDLDTILAKADEVKGSLGKKLREGKEDALLSRELAAIDREVPLDITLDDMKLRGWDREKLLLQFTSLGFQSMIPRFGLDAPETAEKASAEQAVVYEEPAAFDLASYEGITKVLLKTAEGSDGKLMLLTAFTAADESGSLTVRAYDAGDPAAAADFLRGLAQGREVVTYDAKALYKALSYYPAEAFIDLGIAAYLAGFESANKTPAELYALVFAKPAPVPDDEALPEGPGEAAKSFMAEAELYAKLKEMLAERSLLKLAAEMEFPLAVVLAEMEARGVKVDAGALRDMGEDFREQAARLEASIYEAAGHAFNINSPKQLGEVLFEEMGITAGRKTAGGAYSTAASELERLAPFYPIVDDVLSYRKVTKLESTFIQGLIKEIGPDGRIHTTFNQTLTATGRLSSAEPNLQNIPMREEEGRRIRRAFVPKEGFVFIDADYSQIELRLLAALSEDENLMDAFRHNKDIHKRTAGSIFGVPEEEVTPSQRAAAKTVNFSIIYGISDFGLAQDLKITRNEAHQYIEGYHRRYPAVEPYMENLIAFGREHGYVETYFGRRRYIPELSAKNFNVRKFGERAAMNAPVQGTAADIMKIAMLRTADALKKEGLDAAILLQVHDELLLEVRADQAKRAAELLREAMEGAVSLPVPLAAEVNTGDNWYDCK